MSSHYTSSRPSLTPSLWGSSEVSGYINGTLIMGVIRGEGYINGTLIMGVIRGEDYINGTLIMGVIRGEGLY